MFVGTWWIWFLYPPSSSADFDLNQLSKKITSLPLLNGFYCVYQRVCCLMPLQCTVGFLEHFHCKELPAVRVVSVNQTCFLFFFTCWRCFPSFPTADTLIFTFCIPFLQGGIYSFKMNTDCNGLALKLALVWCVEFDSSCCIVVFSHHNHLLSSTTG